MRETGAEHRVDVIAEFDNQGLVAHREEAWSGQHGLERRRAGQRGAARDR